MYLLSMLTVPLMTFALGGVYFHAVLTAVLSR